MATQVSALNILIVDDNPIDVEILTRHLNAHLSQSFKVWVAHNAYQGKNMLLSDLDLDLVFLDLHLCDENGIHFIQSLPNIHEMPPIILLSSDENETMISEAITFGAMDYILKSKIREYSFPQIILKVNCHHQNRLLAHESIKSFETLMSKITDALVVIDPKGNIHNMNAKLKSIFIDCEKGDNLYQVKHPLIEVVRQRLNNANLGESEERDVFLDGSKEYWRIKTFYIESQQKLLMGIILKNITHEKFDAKKKQELLENQQQFVADAAHEFKNPLGSIMGNLELLVRYPNLDFADQQEIVMDALKETRRIKKLIDDMLILSRGSEIQSRQKTIPLNEEAREIFHDFSHNKKTHSFHFNERDTVLIDGDPEQIRRMLIIFLDNACKYTPTQGSIHLKICKQGDFACVEVKDTGIGIPENMQTQIFERFFRTPQSQTFNDDPGGSGLGLSIAKQIIDKHNGHITVESQLGQGTRFTIHLPLHTSS